MAKVTWNAPAANFADWVQGVDDRLSDTEDLADKVKELTAELNKLKEQVDGIGRGMCRGH